MKPQLILLFSDPDNKNQILQIKKHIHQTIKKKFIYTYPKEHNDMCTYDYNTFNSDDTCDNTIKKLDYNLYHQNVAMDTMVMNTIKGIYKNTINIIHNLCIETQVWTWFFTLLSKKFDDVEVSLFLIGNSNNELKKLENVLVEDMFEWFNVKKINLSNFFKYLMKAHETYSTSIKKSTVMVYNDWFEYISSTTNEWIATVNYLKHHYGFHPNNLIYRSESSTRNEYIKYPNEGLTSLLFHSSGHAYIWIKKFYTLFKLTSLLPSFNKCLDDSKIILIGTFNIYHNNYVFYANDFTGMYKVGVLSEIINHFESSFEVYNVRHIEDRMYFRLFNIKDFNFILPKIFYEKLSEEKGVEKEEGIIPAGDIRKNQMNQSLIHINVNTIKKV